MSGVGIPAEVVLDKKEECKRVVYALQTNYVIKSNGERYSYQSWIVINDIPDYETKWFLNHNLIELKDVAIPISGFICVQNVNGDILAVKKP